ncbi:MAG: hypothetical protein ACXW2P_11115, partial [Thermoanaerobaculia bacterium]
YLHGPSSTWGDLIIDNGSAIGQNTELPALGRGGAQNGTNGNTLVTDRTADIAPYFEGHWVEIRRGDALLGTWRIATINIRTVTLDGATALQAGDSWAGVYRFDTLTLRSTLLVTEDQLRVAAVPDKGAGSSIIGNNAGPPIVNASLIRIEQRPTGLYLAGDAGAVTDTDLPITVFARNASAGVFSGPAGANGSFSVQLFGAAGEAITLSARDGNFFPLESTPILAGTLPVSSSTAMQISRTLWTTDTTFRAQAIAADGTLLAVTSTNVNGSTSDKLVVLDTTNPSLPAHLRTIATGAGAIRDLHVANGWAYVAANRLLTVDLAAATPVVNLAGVDPSGSEQAVAVAGGYAFTASTSSGTVHVYDVSDPSVPRHLRTQAVAPNEGVFTDLIAYGTDHVVGLIDGNATYDVIVIDRRNVMDLLRAGNLSIPSFSARRGSILGSRLYAVGPSSSEVVIVDLGNPANPLLSARLPLPAIAAGHVRIAADLGFVANTTGGLTATSLDPSNFLVAGNAAATGSAQDVAITAGHAYVANESGIAILPITTAPVIDSGQITLTRNGGNVTATGGTRSMTGSGTFAATLRNQTASVEAPVAIQPDGRIEGSIAAAGADVIHITASDAQHAPTTRSLGPAPFVAPDIDVRATIAADNAFFARRIAVDGASTFITGGTLRGNRLSSSSNALLFRQPNASEPAQISATVAAVDEVNDSTSRAGFGYFAGSRFSTLNYLNTTPTMNLASSDPAGRELAVALIGNYAFVAAEIGTGGPARGSQNIYHVSSPTAPLFVRSQDMIPEILSSFSELIAFGTDKLIGISTAANRDVTVIDISSPSNLVRMAIYDVPSFVAHRGALSGNTLYLTGGDAGVAIVDLTNASSPQHLVTIDTPGIAFGVAERSAAEIVVADGSRGLTFINTTTRNAPVILGSQPLQGSAVDVKVVNGYIHVATETRYYVLRP